MSRSRLARTLTFPRGFSRLPVTHLPPPFLLPSLSSSPASSSASSSSSSSSSWRQKRSFLLKRSASNSFWAPSYPSTSRSAEASSSSTHHSPPPPRSTTATSVPPHVPIVPHFTSAVSDGANQDPGIRKKERKQKYLDSLMDRAGELTLRCSIMDCEGNWTAEEGKYKKSELCRDYDLDPRDLRKLDSIAPNLVPIIVTRRTVILISMLHLRVLIKPDRVIVFDTAGSAESEVQRRFKWHLERNVKAGVKTVDIEEGEEEIGLSYEHRALESILVATANALEEEMAFTRRLVQQLLADLEDDINRDNLKRLLHYSRRMMGFQSRARYVKRAVDELLESDEDLSAMYLTSNAQGRPRALHDHEQLELLLESFGKQVEEIVSEVDTTVANMNSTQEIAELMLDSGRNALLALDVKISIATLGVGTGALVAGMFGMNLSTQLETHPHAFWIVSGGAAFITFLICVMGMRIMRRVRRVALSGSDSTPLRRLMSSQAWDAALASLTHGPPTNFIPPPTKPRLGAAMWNRIFRRRPGPPIDRYRSKRDEPVWINKQADLARARDAWRYQEIMDKDMKKGAGYNDFKSLEKAWKHSGDSGGPSRWEARWANWGRDARRGPREDGRKFEGL